MSCIFNDIPRISAYTLILSSASIGAIIGWRIGAQDSYLLGILFGAAALCAEFLKPLAVKNIFKGPQRWPSLFIAASCICFSFYNELSLSSLSRSDAVSARRAHVSDTDNQTAQRTALVDALRALPPSRLPGIVSADLAAVAAQKGIGDCDKITTTFQKKECSRYTELKKELSITEEKIRLTNESNKALVYSAIQDADPLSTNVAYYFGLFGVNITSKQLSPLFSLIFPLMLEITSAFALLLVVEKSKVEVLSPIKEFTQITQTTQISKTKSFVHIHKNQKSLDSQIKSVLKSGFAGSPSDLAELVNKEPKTVLQLISDSNNFSRLNVTRLNNKIVWINKQ